MAVDDGESAWDENPDGAHRDARRGEAGMAAAVRALPLELREPLLIIVLAGLTHQEAAAALDISLGTLITRLTKARERVATLTRPPLQAQPVRAAPHLRVVK
jgi:RNA polymerase sigma-70 factor (ECF subfamily)